MHTGLRKSHPLLSKSCNHLFLRPRASPISRHSLRHYATSIKSSEAHPVIRSTTPPPPPPSSFYQLWRLSFLSFALVSFTVYTIRKTTADIFGIQGLSMFPLLRPSISQAEAFMLTDGLTSRDGKTISKERDAIFAQDRDRIVIVPPVERQWLLISTPFLRIRSALCWMLGATGEHNFRLGDSPLEEGGDGRRSNLERGMVVVFYTPYERERQAVKRIVALEGDIVVPADSSVRASNTRGLGRRRILWEEQRDMDDLCSGWWVRFTIDEDGTQKQMAGIQVPYGHVWLEGVNQAASIDSNELGPISKSLIIGVATGVVYPFSRIMPWKDSWQDDCAGRVFKRNGIGRYRAVNRTDESENNSGEFAGEDDFTAGGNSLVRVPAKWAM